MKDADNDRQGLGREIERLERRIQGLQAESTSLVEKLIESRRSEESLSETLVGYQRGLEGSGISLAILDAEMTVLDANEAIERLTGYKLIELRDRMRWTDLVDPADGPRLDFFLRMRAENPEKPPANYEFRIRDKAGNLRSVIVNVRPLPRSIKYVATFIDVSLLKSTEQALRDTEDRYLALFNSSLDLIFLVDFEGQFLDANKRALDLLGYSRHEIGDVRLATILEPEDMKQALHLASLFYQQGRYDETTQWRLRCRDGRHVWVELTGSRVDREGKPYAVIGIARDVTERRKADKALRSSEQRFRAMFDHASEMIFIHDMAGRFIDMNDRSLKLLGCTRADLRNITLRDIIDIEDLGRATEGMGRLFSEGASVGPVELRLRLEDGTRRWMEVSTVRLDLGDESYVALGIARDVSARKEAEDKLRSAEMHLRASQKMEAVGRLAAGLAHEFSNLLNVVGGHAELSLDGLHPEDPLRESLEEIRKASRNGAALTKQLLAFSSSQFMRPEVVDLNSCVRSAGTMLGRLIGENIEFITRLEEVGKVMADPAQMEQVILNLAVNARDAMPEGGKLVIETYDADLDDDYTASHAGVAKGSYVILAVTDTGQGMDEYTVQHIFEPFFTTKDSEMVAGMGLSTVFGIVRQSGGNVWVYSEPGKGSTFKIYLPRLDTDEPTTRDSAPDLAALVGVETILVVEDEDMVRNIVTLTLREHGYTVLEARNAEEALEVFAKRKGFIDVVVSDVIMPGMSGRDLAERLASEHGHTRVLLMSGYPGTAAEHKQLVARGVAFLSKPVAARTLVAKVREILDSPVPGR